MCKGIICLLCCSFCIYSVKHFNFLMQNPLMKKKKKSLSGWIWICLLFWWHRLNFQLTRGRIKYYIFFQSIFHLYTVIRACAKGSWFCLHVRAVTDTHLVYKSSALNNENVRTLTGFVQFLALQGMAAPSAGVDPALTGDPFASMTTHLAESALI